MTKADCLYLHLADHGPLEMFSGALTKEHLSQMRMKCMRVLTSMRKPEFHLNYCSIRTAIYKIPFWEI